MPKIVNRGPRSTGGQTFIYQTQSSDFTATANYIYGVDTTLNAVIATLPTNAPVSTLICFIDAKSNFSVNNLTIDLPAGETIYGGNTLVLTEDKECISLVKTDENTWLRQSGEKLLEQIANALTYVLVSADFNVSASTVYGVDTRLGPIVATLPTAAPTSTLCYFSDVAANFGTHSLTIQAAVGDTIYGDSSITLDATNEIVALIKGTDGQWVSFGTQTLAAGNSDAPTEIVNGTTRLGIDTPDGIVTGTVSSIPFFKFQTGNDALLGDIAIGENALAANPAEGRYNIAIGTNALAVSTDGWYNMGLGSYALANNTTGTDNNACGDTALSSNTTGSRNTAANYALQSNTTGNDNTALGYRALSSNSTGNTNTAIGSNSLTALTTGTLNIAIGNLALNNATTAEENIAIGDLAGAGIIDDFGNVAIGPKTMATVTTRNNGYIDACVGVGYGAQEQNNSYNFGSTSVGYYSLREYGKDLPLTGGPSIYGLHTAIGYRAMEQVKAGGESTAVGAYAMWKSEGNPLSEAFGAYALDELTTGVENGAYGLNALGSLTTGAYNVAVGAQALRDNTVGQHNVALGYDAGKTVSGTSNIYLGSLSASRNTAITVGQPGWTNGLYTGNQNTYIGCESGYGTSNGGVSSLAVSGSNNIVIGYRAAPSFVSVSNEITLGNSAITSFRIPGLGFSLGNLSAATDGQALVYDLATNRWIPGSAGGGEVSNKIEFGTSKVEIPVIDDRIVFTSNGIVVGALEGATTGVNANNNVILGPNCSSGYIAGLNSIYNTVSLGFNTLTNANNVNDCVVIGSDSGDQLLGANSSVIIGDGSVRAAGYFEYSVAIGDFALEVATDVQGTVAIGSGALSDTTVCLENTCVGWGTAVTNTTGNYLTTLGSQSLRKNTVGSRNTAIGMFSLYNNINGNNNTGLGAFAGTALNAGSSNLYLGAYSGAQSTMAPSGTGATNPPFNTHNNVTLIGYNSQASNTTASNEITLGDSSITALRCNVTSITSLSDARDKTDISPLTLGLEFINTLNPVTYKWDKREWYENGERDGSKTENKVNVGFLAQDLQSAQIDNGAEYMNLVYAANPDKLEATPGNLIYALVKAVQELSAEVVALKAQLP